VVAVVVGYFLGGEAIGPRTIAGTALVLVSVVVITTTPKQTPEARPMISEVEAVLPDPE
jgi:drug/metabolite transporter (DMT)-like permease